jgi:glycosyltransferase involved in cell wall biosynthesis
MPEPSRAGPARRLSVVMIALNEEERLARTLDAIRCADEVLLVDGGSTDRTVELARARGCRVVERPMTGGFGAQKRFAVAQARHDWVMNLDADEVLTPALNDEVAALLRRPVIEEAAFQVEMTLVFMGRPFRFGKHARERHVRLFDRTRAGYNDLPVHEGIEARGPVGLLRERLFHHSFRDLHHFVAKMNDYTTRGARMLHAEGARRPAALAALSWPFYFLKSYLLQRNFLNGVPGLVWSFLFSLQPVVKYLKLAEMGRER